MDADQARVDALAVDIIKALTPGNGCSNSCETVDELTKRLDSDGVIFDPIDIGAALARLETPSPQEGCTVSGLELYRIVRVPPKHSAGRSWSSPGPDWDIALGSVKPF
jgi:hypothetical protein